MEKISERLSDKELLEYFRLHDETDGWWRRVSKGQREYGLVEIYKNKFNGRLALCKIFKAKNENESDQVVVEKCFKGYNDTDYNRIEYRRLEREYLAARLDFEEMIEWACMYFEEDENDKTRDYIKDVQECLRLAQEAADRTNDIGLRLNAKYDVYVHIQEEVKDKPYIAQCWRNDFYDEKSIWQFKQF